MAVTLTGTPVKSTSYSSGNMAVTIPADAGAVVVFSWGFRATTALDFSALNWDNSGLDFAQIVTNKSTSDPYDVWAYIMTIADGGWPGTGAKTLYFTFSAAPTEGGTVFVCFVKGLDTADPIRDTDSVKATPAGTGINWTASLAGVLAGDLTLGAIAEYYDHTTVTVTNGGQTALGSAANENSVEWGIAYEQGEASPNLVSVADSGWGYAGAIAFALKAAAGGATLEAGPGAFTLVGQAAGLLAGRRLAAGAGAFSLAGQTVGLLRGSLLPAGAGAFALSGQPAGLLAGRQVGAGAGAFTLGGQAVGLLAGRLLPGAAGAFFLTGQDVTLTYTPVGAFTLIADAGAFTLTGQAAGLLRGYLVPAGAGAFALAGQDATLVYTPVGAFILTAGPGAFSLTGQTAGLLRGLRLPAEAGALLLTGQAASLFLGRRVGAGAGAFALGGQAVGLLQSHLMPAGAGAFLLTGQDAGLYRGYLVAGGSGAFALTGQAVDLLHTYLLEVAPGVFVLTGQAVDLDWSGKPIASGLATITFSGRRPKITFTGARPDISFSGRKPKITFTGQGG